MRNLRLKGFATRSAGFQILPNGWVQIVGMFAVLHFLVDALCVCCLFLMASAVSTSGLWGVFVIYNVLAFLTQPLTGMLADRVRRHEELLALAVALLALGVAVSPFSSHSSFLPVIVSCLLGMGNSLFHVVGGKQVAVASDNDIRALGVFVSTGAFGLAVGMVFHSWILLFGLLIGVAAGAMVIGLPTDAQTQLQQRRNERGVQQGKAARAFSPHFVWMAVLILMGLVMLRSMVGETFTGFLRQGTGLLLVGAVAMLGKAAGGWLARWMGIVWSLLMMVAAVTVVMWAAADRVPLLGLFLVNLTMPVTLYLINVVMSRREGLAFGLLAATLMPGYLLAQTGAGSDVVPGLLLTLVPTIIIELCLLWLMYERRADVLWSSVVVNILTNVPLNLIVTHVDNSVTAIVVAEVVVVAVETLWYRYFVGRWRLALAYGFLCNAISFLIGLLIQQSLLLFGFL